MQRKLEHYTTNLDNCKHHINRSARTERGISLTRSYFQSLADGDVPPVKGRFEDVSSVDKGAATKGILQVLHTQVRQHPLVPYSLKLSL